MDGARLPLAWDELAEPMAVNVGNPHIVFFRRCNKRTAPRRAGPRIEQDAAFPERINVNVASIQGDMVTLRTWERGRD
jgi:diaminopimelate epimerase